MKCSKCGNEPKEVDKFAWKCTSCGKAYGVKLPYLQKLQEKKNSSGATSLLKCKECGESLDNGNEKIFWKCSCGNVQSGKLEEFLLMKSTVAIKKENTSLLVKSQSIFCSNCGIKLQENEKYCSNCGKMVYGEEKKRFCIECGEVVSSNKRYCPNCGRKLPLEIDNNVSLKVRGFKNKLSLKKVIATFAVFFMLIGLILAGKTFIPQIFVSTSDLLAEGNYKKAYSKAKKNQKDDVLLENLISYECKEAVNNLKDPSSFQLREAWYDKENSCFVLSISGKNGMGGAATSYWYYKYSEEDNEYQLITAISDLDKEEYSYFDDAEDKLEKVLNNAARDAIKDIIYQKDYEVDNSTVKNINGLHKKDILQDVKLLDEVKEIYPEKSSDEV